MISTRTMPYQRMEKSWSYLEMMKLKIDNLVMDLLRKLLF